MRAYCILLLSVITAGAVHCSSQEPVAAFASSFPADTPSASASAEGGGDDERVRRDAGTTTTTVDAGAAACHATDPRTTPVRAWALPDAGETPYVDFLNDARTSIRVFGYQMGIGAVLDTLETRARAGLDVHVILDGATQKTVNDKYRLRLEAAGAKFEWSDATFSYMHAKTMIIDDREALVSTGNYSRSYMLKERNYVARIVEPQDVADLVRLFDADWARVTPDLSCTRLVVSPTNSQDRLVELVQSAQHTIIVESMQYAERSVREAVLARKAAGVDVRVLLAAPAWIDTNAAAGADLARSGVAARYLAVPALHVKSIVVDGARAYFGSENISYTSLAKNREIGVVVSDRAVLDLMVATFEADWAAAAATPFVVDAGAP